MSHAKSQSCHVSIHLARRQTSDDVPVQSQNGHIVMLCLHVGRCDPSRHGTYLKSGQKRPRPVQGCPEYSSSDGSISEKQRAVYGNHWLRISLITEQLKTVFTCNAGRDTTVGKATSYGFEVRGSNAGEGDTFDTDSDQHWGPPGHLCNAYRVSYPAVKWPGRGVNHPFPFSAEVKEKVALYLYSLSELSRPLPGRTLPLLPTETVNINCILRLLWQAYLQRCILTWRREALHVGANVSKKLPSCSEKSDYTDEIATSFLRNAHSLYQTSRRHIQCQLSPITSLLFLRS
jgi:hypothetical protein